MYMKYFRYIPEIFQIHRLYNGLDTGMSCAGAHLSLVEKDTMQYACVCVRVCVCVCARAHVRAHVKICECVFVYEKINI